MNEYIKSERTIYLGLPPFLGYTGLPSCSGATSPQRTPSSIGEEAPEDTLPLSMLLGISVASSGFVRPVWHARKESEVMWCSRATNPDSQSTAVQKVWRLLHWHLRKHENRSGSRLHCCNERPRYANVSAPTLLQFESEVSYAS